MSIYDLPRNVAEALDEYEHYLRMESEDYDYNETEEDYWDE